MNQKIPCSQRILAFFLAMFMLCSLSLPVLAEAAPSETPPLPAETSATSETATSTEDSTDSSTTENNDTTALSDAAQAFVDAVAALDRDAIISASNAWGLASKAWQADQSNAELESALNDAIAAQDAACAPLYNAEDLYNALSADEQGIETVAAAYSRFEEIWTAMVNAMENPVESENDDESDELEKIVAVMYSDLPKEPTGYYLDSNGLPVVTGDTLISIEGWGTEDYSDIDPNSATQVALDADLLDAESAAASFPHIEGKDYAIIPISTQILYPENGSCADITLPDDVTLLGYSFTSDNLMEATADERKSMLHYDFSEVSASVAGIYVLAHNDFEATLTYTDSSKTITKTLTVTLDDSAPQSAILTDRFSQESAVSAASTYELNAAPRAGLQVTQCVNTSVGWMNYLGGQQVLCADKGKWAWGPGATYANKYPPVATYTAAGSVWVDAESFGKGWTADQATIWAAGFNNGTPAAKTNTYALDENSGDASYYDRLAWQAQMYPDSMAASIVNQLNQATPYIGPGESQTVYLGTIYTPSNPAWQRFVFLDYNPVVLGGDTEIPGLTPDGEPIDIPWEASYERTATLDLTYTVNADKIQLETGEKVDGASIDIEPILDGIPSDIDGGSWTITPVGKQSVTTSGHTDDNSYHQNGGDGTVSWTIHYEVTKSASKSGKVTVNSEQDADTNGQEQANQQQAAAQADCEAQVNAAIEAALALAHSYFDNIQYRYDETDVPYGFDEYDGELGSHQTITVPADSSNDYVMKNDEWSLQVNLKKVDSETGEQIAGDALYEVYEWDTVTQQYIPYGDYNQYSVVRNPDGTYSVANGSNYGTGFDTSRKMYYTQRNEGKFIIVETKAPDGYYGDWTDVEHPGTADTPLGKRGYYIEITKANDGSVITLDNTHYSADIATSYTGGTKLLTSGGVETTVTIYKAGDEPAAEIQYQDAGRIYDTDNSKTAANEDSYTMTPITGVMQNDRVLGEISLSKVDLDAVRYVGGRDTDGDAMASGQAHADARLDGAVYDLYAAEDIQHPDGVTGTVDYSKITYADGTPIWHTTIRDNSGQWVDDYLPVLAKDHLVASAVIKDGWLTFSNLYLGKYYIVERGTGVVIPVEDGAYKVSGTYPNVDSKTKEPTGTTSPLTTNEQGQYTDYVYKHQWSYIGQSKAHDGTKTYDGYYESYATGYLCDEHNYYITPAYADEGWYVEKTAFEDNRQAEGEQRDTTDYSANYHIHRDNELAESQDQVMKGNVELSKHVSSTGSSDGIDLEGAGFTFYLISDLSKADQFATTRSGKYLIKSILDAYINPEYDESSLKYDFTGESQAIAKTYEVNADQIAAYNATLTAAGDFKNGSGDGWVATGRPNEYQLAEIFSNDTGNIRVQGLPYGQYLVVETTTPKDVFQAEPFIVTIDPTDESNPQSAMANPKDAVQAPSDSYQKYTVLDEEIEVYLRITKIDDETGKPVVLPNTAFQIYWMDEAGNHIIDENGNAKLVTMTDTSDPLLPKVIDTFYTNESGVLVLPEKLPLGHYRIVEINGPEGFYNEWIASAVYEDGILHIDDTGRYEDGTFYVDFEVSTERAYKATGDDSEDGQDILVIDEEYRNNETLGVLTIRKTGPVLTGWQEDGGGILDPEFSGEARPGHFVYEDGGIPYAEYTITANEDIYTQDHQLDGNGNRTLWYAKGDVVAVVQTGDGTSDIATFAPGRTNATYDFLSVIHNGTVGEVTVTLPLGSYHVEETNAPYGFVGTKQSYDVTFVWDNQTNDVVLAETITNNPADGSTSQTTTYPIININDATADQIEAQTLSFYNDRVKPQLDVYKRDIKTGELVAGAVYNLITVDDIYSATGDLLFRAGDLIATSAPTDANGHTTFTCDFPLRGQFYGMDGVQIPEHTTANSGKYRIVELRPPQGYFLDAPDQEFEFVYKDGNTPVIKIENTFQNDATSFYVSKRALTGDDELPGATLTIQDKDGNVVRRWVSGTAPTEIRGLKFDTVYTLVETAAPNGYEVAESIRFKLVQRKDENGDLLNETDVYVCTGKDWLIIDHWTLMEDGTVVMRDAPSPDTPDTPDNPTPTPTPTPEQPSETPTPTPTTSVPQTGDGFQPILWLALIAISGGALAVLIMRKRKNGDSGDNDHISG